MATQYGAKPMNRQFKIYGIPVGVSAISDATTRRPDSYEIADLTLQKTVYGHIAEVVAGEKFTNDKTIQPRQIAIRCRYFAGLSTKSLVYFDTKLFDIVSATEIGIGEFWDLVCVMNLGKATLPDGGELP